MVYNGKTPSEMSAILYGGVVYVPYMRHIGTLYFDLQYHKMVEQEAVCDSRYSAGNNSCGGVLCRLADVW